MLDTEFIKSLNTKSVSLKAFNIIFSIEYVICFPLSEEEEIDISGFSLNSYLIHLKDSSCYYNYFFFPHFGELFLQILSWDWNIGFYSTNEQKLDEALIRKFFIKFLGNYLYKAERIYDKLISEKRIRILSDVIYNSTFTTMPFQTGFDIENVTKVDLRLITNFPQNTILIEQKREHILGAHYPYIAIDKESSINYAIYFEMILEAIYESREEFPQEDIQNNYSASNNAFYIMGILQKARNLINNRKAYSLKQALDKVIYNESYYQDNDHKISEQDTPWLLSPLPEHNPKSEELIEVGKTILRTWSNKLRMAS